MVRIDEDVFAMPLESVVEIVRLKPSDLSTVMPAVDRPRARPRDFDGPLGDAVLWAGATRRATPARRRGDARDPRPDGQRSSDWWLTTCWAKQDIVVKSSAENYRNVPGIAGASILGDGRVSLILDLAALIDMASKPIDLLGNQP